MIRSDGPLPEAAAILARHRGEPPSPAAARARRSRWRRRNGLVPRTIDVDEHGLAEALILSGPSDRSRGAAPRVDRAGAESTFPAAAITKCSFPTSE
jgi:hypothetical protein